MKNPGHFGGPGNAWEKFPRTGYFRPNVQQVSAHKLVGLRARTQRDEARRIAASSARTFSCIHPTHPLGNHRHMRRWGSTTGRQRLHLNCHYHCHYSNRRSTPSCSFHFPLSSCSASHRCRCNTSGPGCKLDLSRSQLFAPKRTQPTVKSRWLAPSPILCSAQGGRRFVHCERLRCSFTLPLCQPRPRQRLLQRVKSILTAICSSMTKN
jgi:hypothetical protein